MYKKFQYSLVNDFHEELLSQNNIQDKYVWEDVFLLKSLLGVLPNERNFFNEYESGFTEYKKEQNQIVDKINSIVDKYNINFKENPICIENSIKDLYSELYKYNEISEIYSRESEIIKALNFSEAILITGVGGIGKTQFIFELSQELKKKNVKSLTIFGKYKIEINIQRIFREIKQITKTEKFYLILDALNELDSKTLNKFIDFIKNNKENHNLRVISSYRNHSLPKSEYKKIVEVMSEVVEFSGVSNEDAIEKISEKYNIDLTVHDHLLANNSPLVFNMIIGVLSENFLSKRDRKPLIKGTHLYESILFKLLRGNGRNRWDQLKEIIKEICKKKSKSLELKLISELLGLDYINFINEMKYNDLISMYEHENIEYLIFKNESLIDYLIARTIFNDLNGKSNDEIIEVIETYSDCFYSINRAIILMLFEKFSKNIEKAIYIIKNSNLMQDLSIEIFNELDLSNMQVVAIREISKSNASNKRIIMEAGGHYNNPFNFTFYLNNVLLVRENSLLNISFNRFDIRTLRMKLKVWIRSIEKYDYNHDYLIEKFWFAFWLSSVPNGNIRYLARKLIFQILKVEPENIDLLIKYYNLVEDSYIKESVIHILSSLKKGNPKIISFFNTINDINLININSLHNIHMYLFGFEKFINEKKTELIFNRDNRINTIIFNFLNFIDIQFKYDYRLLNMNVFKFSMNDISFQFKFLENKKDEIEEIRNKIIFELGCPNGECPIVFDRSNYVKEFYEKNSFIENLINEKEIYLSWQKRFKYYLKKYKISVKSIKDIHINDPDEKNNIHKALDLSISDIEGSFACNYYLSSIDNYSDGDIGYEKFTKDKFNESIVLYYPISIYNESIEGLNNLIIRSLSIPKKKSKTWAKNYKLSIENFRNIMKPLKYDGNEWRLIYGKVQKERWIINKSLLWRDFYILSLSIDNEFTLTGDTSIDREYTIETPELYCNPENFDSYDFSRTSSVHGGSDFDKEFIKTDFNIPPIKILKELNLHYERKDSTWRDSSNEIVIMVNNNKGHFYDEGVTGSIYLKENIFQELLKRHEIKYFGFCERYWETGYNYDSSLQIELYLDGTQKYYKHYRKRKSVDNIIKDKCKSCSLYKKNKKKSKSTKENYDDLIKFYLGEKDI